MLANARLVLSHARYVLSAAKWSRATEPLFSSSKATENQRRRPAGSSCSSLPFPAFPALLRTLLPAPFVDLAEVKASGGSSIAVSSVE